MPTTFAILYEGLRDAQAILGHHSAKFTLEVYKKPIALRQQAGGAGSPAIGQHRDDAPEKKTG